MTGQRLGDGSPADTQAGHGLGQAAAQAHAGGRPGVVSKDARSVALQLLDLPPHVRRPVVYELSERERTFVLAEVLRETGTAYGLWHDDPVGFVEDALGESVWSKQAEILRASITNKRVIVPAGFGVGKTFLVARAAAWHVLRQPIGTSLVVTTAPRFRQVKFGLWPHLRKVVAKAGLPGETDQVQWKVPDPYGTEIVAAYGFSAPDTDESAMQGIHCVADDHEVLTNEGWKFFQDLRGDEQVLTLRPDGVAEWGPITKVHEYDFDGHLNVHDGPNARISFAITDNHRIVSRPMYYGGRPGLLECPYCGDAVGAKGRRQHEKKHLRLGAEPTDAEWRPLSEYKPNWQIREYRDLPDEFFVRRTNTWQGSSPSSISFDQLAHGRKKARAWTFDMLDWARFLGWFVSEGSVTRQKRGQLAVVISQSRAANPAKHAEIGVLLKRMGVVGERAKGSANCWSFASDVIGEWLIEHVGKGAENKRVPECVREGSPEVMRQFLDAFRQGDGCHHTHEDSARYITSSRLLADDLQEMLVKLGTARKLRVMHPAGSVGRIGDKEFVRDRATYMLNEAGRPSDSNVKKSNVRRERYVGKVYCISTPYETFMVRRHGTTWWSGNSQSLLVIVDESGGVSRIIGHGTNNLLTGDEATLIATGNPPTDDPGSWFEEVSNEGWSGEEPTTTTIDIPTTLSPAITDEYVVCRDCPPMIPKHSMARHMPDQDWVDRTVRAYGPDHPYVIAKVHARFPQDVGRGLIPTSWVAAAMEKSDPEGPHTMRLNELGLATESNDYVVTRKAWVRLGVDVAAAGGDELVVSRAIGDLLHVRHASSGAVNADALAVAERVLEEILEAQLLAQAIRSPSPVRVKIDVVGLGWGVYSNLVRWGKIGRHEAQIIKVDVRESLHPERRRFNDDAAMRPHLKRDELWVSGRALLAPDPSTGEGSLRLRIDDKTAAQLTTPRHTENSSGFTVVESKDSMKKRGIASPDRAESLLMSAYEPEPIRERRRRGILMGA